MRTEGNYLYRKNKNDDRAVFIYYDYHLFFGNPEWRDHFVSLVEGMMRIREISKPEEEENHGEELEVKKPFWSCPGVGRTFFLF